MAFQRKKSSRITCAKTPNHLLLPHHKSSNSNNNKMYRSPIWHPLLLLRPLLRISTTSTDHLLIGTNTRRPDSGRSWPVDYVIKLAVPFPSLSLPLLLFYSPPSPFLIHLVHSFLVIYIFVKSMILSLSSSIPHHSPCLLFFEHSHKENLINTMILLIFLFGPLRFTMLGATCAIKISQSKSAKRERFRHTEIDTYSFHCPYLSILGPLWLA